MKRCPLADLARFTMRLLSGRIWVGRPQTPTPAGVLPGFVPFLEVDHAAPAPTTGSSVWLRVFFRVRRTSFWQRALQPRLTIPFFAGTPGFLHKVYSLDRANRTFSGLYTWASAEAAEAYVNAYPGTFMRLLSQKGSFRYEVLPILEENQ